MQCNGSPGGSKTMIAPPLHPWLFRPAFEPGQAMFLLIIIYLHFHSWGYVPYIIWYIYIHSKQCPCSLKKIPPIHYQSPHSPPSTLLGHYRDDLVLTTHPPNARVEGDSDWTNRVVSLGSHLIKINLARSWQINVCNPPGRHIEFHACSCQRGRT